MSEDTTTSEQLAEIEEQPEPQAEPLQVREGRWKTRGGKIVQVVPTDEARERDRNNGWLWMGGAASESDYWHADGTWLPARAPHDNDLVEYLGPIEPQPEPQPEPQATEFTPPDGWRVVRFGEQLLPGDVWVNDDGTEERANILHWDAASVSGGRCIRRIKPEPQSQPQPADTAIEELRSEVSYVQNLLGSEKRRVGELEELVTSLQRELAVVKEQLTTAAAVCQQLQIELDAAQQVPADSPELQQLRLRLADMTLDRDQYKTAYDSIFADLFTIKETTKAEAVEAIVEWLEPVRRVDSPSLANETMQHLPQIMRHLTGLDSHAID